MNADDPSDDYCRVDSDAAYRPANKSEAVNGGVVGGTVIGAGGAGAAGQVGLKWDDSNV
jgi:hypothetical protein